VGNGTAKERISNCSEVGKRKRKGTSQKGKVPKTVFRSKGGKRKFGGGKPYGDTSQNFLSGP